MGTNSERSKDLLIAIFGFLLMSGSIYLLGKIPIQEWVLRFAHYAGIFTFLIYVFRFRLAALGIDPNSNQAFKEYLKLGSFYIMVIFIQEMPIMLASL